MRNSWSEIKEGFQKSPNNISVVSGAEMIEGDTLLDIVVNNASIIFVNKYLRILCSGNTDFDNIFRFNKRYKNIIGENKYAFAHDAFGGIFALSGNGTQFFSPDTLLWDDLEISYNGFIKWISTVDISADFYSTFLWCDYEKYLQNVDFDSGVMMYPFLWAKECDVNTASKKIVSFDELLVTNYEFAKGFESAE